MRMRPARLFYALDTPSICSTYVDVKSGLKVLTCFILLLDLSLGLLSDMVHPTMKSIKNYTSIDRYEQYWVSNSLSFIVYFIIRYEVSGRYKIIFNGWSIKTIIEYTWKYGQSRCNDMIRAYIIFSTFEYLISVLWSTLLI